MSNKKIIETYLGGIKPYLQKELKLHDIPNIEVARHKEKPAEHKLEGIKIRGDNHYDKKKRHNVGTVKILGHSAINATKLDHMPMKWKIDWSHLTVTLTIEKEEEKQMLSMQWWLDPKP